MGVELGTALIASAAIGAGASAYSAHKQSSAQRKAADAQRKAFEQQQLELSEANKLSSGSTSDSLTKVETGAGTDVGETSSLLSTSTKKKKSTSTSLGVV